MRITTPTKSPEDKRDYRVVRLDNGMRITLVSDSAAPKAAAAVTVNVGSVHNPPTVLGLAHFLEHMLFLGTEKYPDENTYNRILAEHGGDSNAYTTAETTCYYFDVAHGAFEEMLDIFAQFFISPLFTPSATERELNAVQNEHSKNLQNDSWRVWMLQRSRCVEGHPFGVFHTGDLGSLRDSPAALGIDVRDALIEFHKTFYSARGMTVCVVGRESLDTLQKWTVDRFSLVADKETPIPVHPSQALDGDDAIAAQARATIKELATVAPTDWRAMPFGDKKGEWLDVVAVRDVRKLQLGWQLPSEHPAYDEGVMHYLSNLIGHEGKGSILSLLKERGLANNLSAGDSSHNTGYAIFDVSIQLTKSAMDRVEEVVAIVFAYIRMLQSEGPQKWFFDELRSLDEMAWRYHAKPNPLSTARDLSASMQELIDQDVLLESCSTRKYNADSIKKTLALLQPELVHVLVLARHEIDDTWETEPVYKSRFRVRTLDKALIKRWSSDADKAASALHLPGPNLFVPTDFTVAQLPAWDASRRKLGSTTAAPLLLHNGDRLCLWHALNSFDMPKGHLLLRIESPQMNVTPRSSMLSTLYGMLVEDALNQFAYDAELAHLRFSVSRTVVGVTVGVLGFHDKLDKLLAKVMEGLFDGDAIAARFDQVKDQAMKRFVNLAFRDSYQYAMYLATAYSEEFFFHHDVMVQHLTPVTLEDVRCFMGQLTDGAHITMMVNGNFTTDRAVALAASVQTAVFGENPVVPSMPLHTAIRPERIVALPAGSNYFLPFNVIDPQQVNSAVFTLYQCTLTRGTVAECAVMDVIDAILSEMVFTQLRTQEQLGYIVSFGASHDHCASSFRVIVQSDTLPPPVLNWRIERCMRFCLEQLRQMPPAQFAKYRESLAFERAQPYQKLSEASNAYWREVRQYTLDFDYAATSSAAIKHVAQSEAVLFFEKRVVNVLTRRKFATCAFGNSHADLCNEILKSRSPKGMLTFTARPDLSDEADALADGCAVVDGTIDVSVLESPGCALADADWDMFKARHALSAVTLGDLNDNRHRLPETVTLDTTSLQ